ncbi:MAG: Holliday junction branch migration protein RuvA [Bacteroidetes bacterium]|nr:Holliday junction branch migration protein RuvA [Bacteroidota bacterium]
MIGQLTGKIIKKKPTQVILDVNGVGYIVNITLNTFDKISNEENFVSLHTHLQVREDSMDLFGFFTVSEKEMFELLISISGVGPKLAQGILSGIQIDELKDALRNGNLSRMIAIPGVGRKTGERLIVELREKVDKVSSEFDSISKEKFTIKNDAVAALTSLGYNQKNAERIIRQILDANSTLTIEELIKEALSLMNN